MEEDLPGLTTSPTSADVAEQMGIKNEEPPADEPLALVKRKIKIEPGLQQQEEEKNKYDMPKDFGEALKDEDQPISVAQQIAIVAQTSQSVVTTAQQTLIYTMTQGVTVPQLVDLIPSAVNGKIVRPFKAYNANRELMGGLSASAASVLAAYSAVPVAVSGPTGAAVPLSVPTVVQTASSPATSSSNSHGGPSASHAHLMTLATEADKLLQKTKTPKSINGHVTVKVESGSGDEAMTPGSTSTGSDSGSAGDLLETTIEKIKKRAALASSAVESVPAKQQPLPDEPPPSKPRHSNSNKRAKKERSPRPDEKKDQHYWERRRKNNEAAKRSRDARRAKEDQIAIRAALLEQENMRLRIEVAALKEEAVKLRAALYNKNN